MEHYAIGVVNIRLSDLEWITPAQLFGSIKQFNEFHLGDKKHDYEVARFIGFWSVAAMGSKIHSPDDLVRFEWENKSTSVTGKVIEWHPDQHNTKH